MAVSSKVGSFAKSTGGAPASQSVTGVGFQPKALILWTQGQTTADSWAGGVQHAIGFTAGASHSHSIGTASADAAASSAVRNRSAAKVLSIVASGGALLAECDLSSFDSDGFTLSWTTNDAVAYTIHYLALGGSDLVNAAKAQWRTGTAAGDKAITGVGFQPTFALHVMRGATATGPPSTGLTARWSFGVMDASAQWALHWLSQDGQATSNTRRAQETACCILDRSTAGGLVAKAAFVSFDSDGFTVNFSSAPSTDNYVQTLCINVTNIAVGNISKSTAGAPTTFGVTGFGFRPAAVFNCGYQMTASTTTQDHARVFFGASDGASDRCGAFQDTDNLADTSCDSMTRDSKAYVKCNNDTPSTDAEASITMDASGFTWNLSTNDAVADQLLYAAFGPAPSAAIMPDAYFPGLSQPCVDQPAAVSY